MDGQLRDSIRVYIYTADNGYSWQGCDGALADSLKKCIGNAADVKAGGLRRGEVGGLNGTALYRRSVRVGGDFAGRDSSYIALAFLPFAHIGNRKVDFAKLWEHPLLAQPLGRSESLVNLSIDLDAEGLFVDALDDGGIERGGFWTEEKSFHDSGAPGLLLARLGAQFQSMKTGLGSFSVKLSESGDGLSAEAKYSPFVVVVETAKAHAAYGNAVSSKANGKERESAFKDWKGKVEKLKTFVNPDSGAFRHFLGFCEFALEEEIALEGSLGGEEQEKARKAVSGVLDGSGRMSAAIGGHLTGGQEPLLAEVEAVLRVATMRIDGLSGDNSPLESRLANQKKILDDLRGQNAKIADWLNGDENGRLDLGNVPKGIDPALLDMARKCDRLQKELVEAMRENANLKAQKSSLEKSLDKNKENQPLKDEIIRRNAPKPGGALPQVAGVAFAKGAIDDVKPRKSWTDAIFKGALWGLIFAIALVVAALAWKVFRDVPAGRNHAIPQFNQESGDFFWNDASNGDNNSVSATEKFDNANTKETDNPPRHEQSDATKDDSGNLEGEKFCGVKQ